MAIELQPVGEDAPTAEAPEETPEAPEAEAVSAAPEETPEPAPKRRGRPPGSKNKPKAPAPAVPAPAAPEQAEPPSTAEASEPAARPAPKRKAKAAPRRPSATAQLRAHVEPETEHVPTPPPTPRTAKRMAWQEYSQRRADEHRARVDAWSARLDRLLAY